MILQGSHNDTFYYTRFHRFVVERTVNNTQPDMLSIQLPPKLFLVFTGVKLRLFIFVQNACLTDHIDVCFDTTFFAMLLDFTMLK